MDETIPEDLLIFISRFLPTIGHLDLLLFVFDRRDQTWTIEELSRELRTNDTLVRQQLARLSGAIRSLSAERYQFAVHHLPTVESVLKLSALYRSHRHAVIAAIYAIKTIK